MSDALQTIEIETAPSPKFAVIWLHGLGADGNDFVPVVPELRLANAPAVRFIFPNAPAIPVTINGGYRMPAWYDIMSLSSTSRVVDEVGIKLTCQRVRTLIDREHARGIAASHIFLAGFSQGGAIAYTAGLTHPEKLAGIIALSTYIPSIDMIKAELSPANTTTPIFAGHGRSDDVVHLSMGEHARDAAESLGNTVLWHTYPMAHSVCLNEINDIGEWLMKRMRDIEQA